MTEHINVKMALDAHPDHAAVIDDAGYITMTNLAWARFSQENQGDPAYTDVGVNYLTVLNQGNALREYEGIVGVLNGDIPQYTNKYPCHAPDMERWFLMTVTPLQDETGIVRALIIHRNITESEWMKNQTVNILESMTDAFFTLDYEWRFTYVNQEAGRLLERNREDLIGEHIWEEFPLLRNSGMQESSEKAVQSKMAQSIEDYVPALDKWFEVHAYPRDQGGLAVFFKDVTSRKQADRILWEMANFDTLTGLSNRRYLYEQLNKKIEQNESLAVLFLDLNTFKDINDAFGHDSGDEVLLETARRLQEMEQKIGGLAARLGGDEFVFVVSETGQAAISRIAEQLLKQVRQPIAIDGESHFSVTASIGIAKYPEAAANVNELMSAADTAMYEAKKAPLAEGTYQFYEMEMREAVKRRIAMSDDLFKALDDGQFYFVFQPQLNLVTGFVEGVEVLSRWEHPELGMIPPPEFIALAEETGKIQPLTERMITEVLEKVGIWREKWSFNGSVAFNVSGSLIESRTFGSFLKAVMEDYQVLPGQIELEITESTSLANSDTLFKHLDYFRSSGISIAIDDFGTGFSKLDHLSTLPVDRIKIDKSFISQIGSGSKGEAILYALIHLVDSLELDIVAEGVETLEQARVLLEKGCTHVQGFYYARPETEEWIVPYIQEQNNTGAHRSR
ncbi:sensor domain-containing protein [Salisediminibacterium beveridgei]|uniref:Diguanylate cyclase/phosphodiesterase (GGDEF & EAL domains) with PAS/PAC sensor(S) n=1 Tax=Salisediminibacterium beveridgei TaxID=632773 RepID=A0A1D7QYR4_9BACI|nr:EAL domain-containing protein [Salisediminibacterium beveridgei]AOM84155.1 diguanylate cyclase/phosphodiesterase (GGDEF & EAL domains) with PAS/PAC sensor(s) [Salisediminibacterium beveridgei]